MSFFFVFLKKRALLASEQFDCTSEVLCIVAMLSIDDQVNFQKVDFQKPCINVHVLF